MFPELSVIVVSYRTPELLRTCLSRLTATGARRSMEILVVDNDSGDASPEVARSFPGVRLLEPGRNLGFAGGVNRGLEAASGTYLVILNPDVEVHPDALDRLAGFLDEHPETGIVAPKLLNTDGSLQYSCRRSYTLTTILLRRTFLGRWFPNAPALRRHLMLEFDHQTSRPVDWVAGAAMMVRRKALEDVGPMEENYFLYFEDVDWCARMQARGWLVQYVPDAVMTHHWQRESLGLTRAARRHIRSGLRFYDRWGGLLYVLRQYQRTWRALALVAADLAAFCLAFITAYLIRQQLAFVLHKPMWPLSFYGGFFAASVLVYAAAFFQRGLYREVKEGDWVDVAFRVGRAATVAALILMASTFLLKMRAYSRVIVLGSWPLVVVFTFLGRRVLHGALAGVQRGRWTLRRTALVGEGRVLDEIEEVMRRHPELGWDPVRIRRTPWVGLPPGQAGQTMVKQFRAERVSEVVGTAASLGVDVEHLGTGLLPLRRAGFGVRLVSDLLATLPPRARVESLLGISWLLLERPALRPAHFGKRALDLAGALLLLAAGAAPFAAALAARGTSGRKIWEPEGVFLGRWGERFRRRRPAGRGWLRDYPALLDVLRGRLSLVGPRPLRPDEEVPGGEAWLRTREHYRPGILGPWSLSPVQTPQEEMHQELRYLEEWSPELDLKLLARVILKRPGGGPGSGSASKATREEPNPETPPAPEARRVHSTGI